jgi:peptidyl-prolyl cis-trans isomerase D
VLKQLRANTKIVMIIVTVFFVAMMVFDWGMDVTGKRRGVQAGIVGMVNKTKIKYDEFDSLVRNQRESMKNNTQLTMNDTRQLNENVWEYLVNNILIEQEIKNRKITYTDKELIDYIQNNPIQQAYQSQIFQDESGNFKIEKYRDFIKNPQNFKNEQTRQLMLYIEDNAKQNLPRTKLFRAIQDGVVVSDKEVEDSWMKDNAKCRIQWFFVNTADLKNLNTTVTPEEAKAYYEKHKVNYKHDELRGLEGVFFKLEPTRQDSVDVLDRAKLLVERARKGEDFSELANSYTEDPANDLQNGMKRGGDLGFFKKGTMVAEFENVAFSMKPGEISNPFASRFGYHIIKVDSLMFSADKKTLEQVKARHILLKIEPSGRTQDEVRNKANAFYEAVKGGADITKKAAESNLQIVKTPLFHKDTQFVPQIGNNTQLLAHRAFKSKKGDVLQLVTTDNGYFVLVVSEEKKAGTPSFEEINARVMEDCKNDSKAKYAEEYTKKVYSKMSSGMDIMSAVAATPDPMITAAVDSSTVTRNFYVQGLGAYNQLMARVFLLKAPGSCTGPVVTDKGSGLAILIESLPIDNTRFDAEKTQIRQKLLSEKRDMIVSNFIEQLKKKAKIVDNRDVFLGL